MEVIFENTDTSLPSPVFHIFVFSFLRMLAQYFTNVITTYFTSFSRFLSMHLQNVKKLSIYTLKIKLKKNEVHLVPDEPSSYSLLIFVFSYST